MNKCLLAKWIFKIESGEDNICCNLLGKSTREIEEFLVARRIIAPNFEGVYWILGMTVLEDSST
jgi:hypothetical protein